jgi:hypothetical protein
MMIPLISLSILNLLLGLLTTPFPVLLVCKSHFSPYFTFSSIFIYENYYFLFNLAMVQF